MKILIFDLETTIWNKGNPYDPRNWVVQAGYKPLGKQSIIRHWIQPNIIKSWLGSYDLIVGFNLKFDLSWLKRYNCLPNKLRIWDCQLAEFLISNQTWTYPDLNTAAKNYGFNGKLDIIKTEYWEKKINTQFIPQDLLTTYLKQDLVTTEEVFLKQLEYFKQNLQQYKLFQVQCEDLLTLMEMEYNGTLVDFKSLEEQEEKAKDEIQKTEMELMKYVPSIPKHLMNWNSNEHLSAFLYGGYIREDSRLQIGVFKSGKKIGQPRYKRIEFNHSLPGFFKPIKGSELAKEGFYATDEPTLKRLKTNKETKRILELIFYHAKMSKLYSTYYKGMREKQTEMNWQDNFMHGQFNQCVARTGRLSSSNPNRQNEAPEFKLYCISRYD